MAQTPEPFDLNSILSRLYQVGPSEEERRMAGAQAMARMGLGILAANQPSSVPRNPLGVLAQGGMAGMDSYQADLQRQMQERRQGAAGALSGLQIQKQLQQQEALKGLLTSSRPTPLGPQAMTMGAQEGDIGPTQTNLKRLDALESNPVAQNYTPIPLEKLGAAAAGGVDINPFLKLNEAARPDVLTIDLGDKIRTIDKRTLRVLSETPKGAAPGSVPPQAQGLSAEEYRAWLEKKAAAGGRGSFFQFLPGAEGYMVGDTRKGTMAPALVGGKPVIPAATSPPLQRDLAAAKAGGTETGRAGAQAQLDLPNAISTAERAIAGVDALIGSKDMKVKPHSGFRSYVGFTLTPGMRFVEGSKEADFEARLNQLKGGAFLQAFEALKGGGAISETEGQKASDAITRMSKAQSEAEFRNAAREYQDVLRTGVRNVKSRAAAGTQTAPAGAPQGVDPALWKVMTPQERALWR